MSSSSLAGDEVQQSDCSLDVLLQLGMQELQHRGYLRAEEEIAICQLAAMYRPKGRTYRRRRDVEVPDTASLSPMTMVHIRSWQRAVYAEVPTELVAVDAGTTSIALQQRKRSVSVISDDDGIDWMLITPGPSEESSWNSKAHSTSVSLITSMIDSQRPSLMPCKDPIPVNGPSAEASAALHASNGESYLAQRLRSIVRTNSTSALSVAPPSLPPIIASVIGAAEAARRGDIVGDYYRELSSLPACSKMVVANGPARSW